MAENMIPRVSICVPTYNRGPFIAQAIESVLAQSYSDWELIIVDDGSTDDTEVVVSKYLADPRISYLKNDTNRHISFTRNRALDAAKGELIAILDSDDYWLDSEKLARQIKFLDEHPDHVLVGTEADGVDPNNKFLKKIALPLDNDEIRRNILWKNPIIHSTAIYRRAAAIAAGKYNLQLNGIEDYDLWLRLGTKSKLANLPEFSVAYRIHPGNIVQTNRLRLMKINLELVRKNRGNYPGYFSALFRRTIRYFLYLTISRFLSTRF